MESARVPLPRFSPKGQQVLLIAVLLVLAFIGWTITDERMNGMDAGPGTDLGSFGFYVTAWVVMMAAMMFPSIWPMVAMYRRVQEGKRSRGRDAPAGATPVFVGGYLVAWTAAGLIAYSIFELIRAVDIDAFSWDRGGPYLAGGVLLAAGIYQLTPLKDICLTKCRNPLMFITHSWKPGRIGALRMGVEHGLWCVGCCWALMASLFALGVMSVGWMVFIAALIAAEKLLAWRAIANRGIAVALIALGIAVAVAPEEVPGLTIPGSHDMEGMEVMGGGSMKGAAMPAGGSGHDAMPATGGGAMPGREMVGMSP